jgi:hypothetical protein
MMMMMSLALKPLRAAWTSHHPKLLELRKAQNIIRGTLKTPRK